MYARAEQVIYRQSPEQISDASPTKRVTRESARRARGSKQVIEHAQTATSQTLGILAGKAAPSPSKQG